MFLDRLQPNFQNEACSIRVRDCPPEPVEMAMAGVATAWNAGRYISLVDCDKRQPYMQYELETSRLDS